MKIKFTKMHGLGNDYIYVDCLDGGNSDFFEHASDFGAISRKLSDRHFGIGADGLILILSSSVADAKMRIFNADGTEAMMCGNGIRCVGKFIYDKYFKINNHAKGDTKSITVDTLSGIKELEAVGDDLYKVNMGKPIFDAEKIPVNFQKTRVINEKLEVNNRVFEITCVSMGNPHCVVFLNDLDDLENFDISAFGPKFEKHKIFPNGTNTEFVKVIDRKTIKLKVWERGSQETLACGTGSCAAVVAAVANNYCENADVTVKLRGGELKVSYLNDGVFMTGKAERVFEGEVEI